MEAGKTKAPTLLRVPQSSNGIIRGWLKFYRPALLKGATHSHIFVHKNGPNHPRTLHSHSREPLHFMIYQPFFFSFIFSFCFPHPFRVV